jgi:hypothetical protein
MLHKHVKFYILIETQAKMYLTIIFRHATSTYDCGLICPVEFTSDKVPVLGKIHCCFISVRNSEGLNPAAE